MKFLPLVLLFLCAAGAIGEDRIDRDEVRREVMAQHPFPDYQPGSRVSLNLLTGVVLEGTVVSLDDQEIAVKTDSGVTITHAAGNIHPYTRALLFRDDYEKAVEYETDQAVARKTAELEERRKLEAVQQAEQAKIEAEVAEEASLRKLGSVTYGTEKNHQWPTVFQLTDDGALCIIEGRDQPIFISDIPNQLYDGDPVPANGSIVEHSWMVNTLLGHASMACLYCDAEAIGEVGSKRLSEAIAKAKGQPCKEHATLTIYHIGAYSYTTTTGAKATVKKYTYSRERAEKLYLDKEPESSVRSTIEDADSVIVERLAYLKTEIPEISRCDFIGSNVHISFTGDRLPEDHMLICNAAAVNASKALADAGKFVTDCGVCLVPDNEKTGPRHTILYYAMAKDGAIHRTISAERNIIKMTNTP